MTPRDPHYLVTDCDMEIPDNSGTTYDSREAAQAAADRQNAEEREAVAAGFMEDSAGWKVAEGENPVPGEDA